MRGGRVMKSPWEWDKIDSWSQTQIQPWLKSNPHPQSPPFYISLHTVYLYVLQLWY